MPLDADIAERLRFAREQALERARAARDRPAATQSWRRPGRRPLLARQRRGWWVKLGFGCCRWSRWSPACC